MFLLNDQLVARSSPAIELWRLGQVSNPSQDLFGTSINRTVTLDGPNLAVGAL
jgi:hypothetical protein